MSSETATLVVVYNMGQPHVRIKLDKAQAEQAVSHSINVLCADRPFDGRDANGSPFKIDLGTKALAVYIELESNDS